MRRRKQSGAGAQSQNKSTQQEAQNQDQIKGRRAKNSHQKGAQNATWGLKMYEDEDIDFEDVIKEEK